VASIEHTLGGCQYISTNSSLTIPSKRGRGTGIIDFKYQNKHKQGAYSLRVNEQPGEQQGLLRHACASLVLVLVFKEMNNEKSKIEQQKLYSIN